MMSEEMRSVLVRMNKLLAAGQEDGDLYEEFMVLVSTAWRCGLSQGADGVTVYSHVGQVVIILIMISIGHSAVKIVLFVTILLL